MNKVILDKIKHIRANKKIVAKGKFYAKEEDTVSFIKSQLLYNSLVSVFDQEFKRMGLNGDLFWTKFEEKFDKYFLH